MSRLPILTGRDVIRALQRAGFQVRNHVGSHAHLVGAGKDGAKRLVTVPDHGRKELPVGTLLSILRQAGLTRDELNKLL